jgi:SAM-dependent methyltransferase
MEKISFERYIESFDNFVQYSEEYGYQADHILQVGNKNLQEGFSMLDIGAGEGFFAKDFINNCKFTPSNYTAIEPSPEHCVKLKQTFKSSEFKMKLIQELFTPQSYLEHKYDLILLSHCSYWFIPDPEPYLLHALNFLKKNGRLVIYLQTPFTASHILNLLLEKDLPLDRAPNHRINSWTITDILDANNVNYDTSHLPGTFNANELFEKNTSLLNDIISFFLSVEAETLDEKILNRAINTLKILSYRDEDNIKLNLEVGAITIHK